MKNSESQHPSSTSISKGILIRGYAFITLAVVVMAVVWFYMITENQTNIEEILEEREESKAVFTMREAAYLRVIALSRMALMNDEFDRDVEYLKIKEQAGKFLAARDVFLEYLNRDEFPREFAIWEELAPIISEGQRWQNMVIDLLLSDEIDKARDILLNKTMPTQNRVMRRLTSLLKVQEKNIESTVGGVSKQNISGLYIMVILAAWAIIWCIIIAIYTIKRTSKTELSIRTAQLKAQEADNQKSQFLANMSHEIRTPLTAIIGFSETLMDEDEKTDNWKSCLNSIVRSGNHLHQLINDILDLSKIEANQLSIEQIPISACQLLAEVDSLMGERARNKGLLFEVSGKFPLPKQIISDPTRLKQILINLCGNAIKFTAEGKVSLKAHYNKENNQMYFTVEDSGIGLSQDQFTTLFKPFKQADASTTREFGGTGLGLYISKQLSEKLGGGLLVESIQGVGSRFTVHIDAGELPSNEWVNSKAEAMTIVSTQHTETVTPMLKGRILLAEDNQDNQRLVSMHIKKTGAVVDVVENGELAVNRATTQTFDLILMDIQMPVMGGIEAIKKLRELGCTTPIATLTANAMKEDRITSEKAGANDFLTKPIDKYAFYAVLARYLSPASVHKQESDTQASHKEHLDDLSDLIDNYVSQLPETNYRIERLLSAKEWEGLKSEIHQLKGTGGAFGFHEITAQCADIEAEILKKDFVSAARLIENLNAICGNIVKAKKR